MDDIRKELFYEQKNGYDLIDGQERLALEEYCREYFRKVELTLALAQRESSTQGRTRTTYVQSK